MSPRTALYGIAAGILGVGLLWAGLTVHGWRRAAALVPGLEQSVADRDATIKQIRHDQTIAQEISSDYQTRLAAIAAERDILRARPVRPVRLCRPAPGAGVLPAGPAGGPDAAATAGAAVPATAGPNLGPGLYGIADDADELAARLSAQLSALQEWSRRTVGDAR